jgi:hypothetical protein
MTWKISKTYSIMIGTITGLFPEEVKKSGKPREYFEEKMLDKSRWGHLDDGQYLIVRAMVKAILDRTYPS